MLRQTALGGVVVVAVLALASCSDDDPSGDPSDGGPSTTPDSFVGALAELPSYDDPVLTVSWSDLAAVRRANGLDGPPDPDDAEARGDYLRSLTGVADGAVVVGRSSRFEESATLTSDDVGFSWLTSEATASVSGSGDEGFAWYAAPDDVTPGADLDDVDPPGDDLYGLGSVFVAVDGRESVVSSTDDAARAWRAGAGGSLADDADVRAVAQAIDDHDAVSGSIVGYGDDRLFGVGWIDDGGDPAFVIVYSLGSDSAASDAAPTLRAGFGDPAVADRLAVDDVQAVGPLVVVTGHQLGRVDDPYAMFQTFALPVPEPTDD